MFGDQPQPKRMPRAVRCRRNPAPHARKRFPGPVHIAQADCPRLNPVTRDGTRLRLPDVSVRWHPATLT
jgi:hypothetical protein